MAVTRDGDPGPGLVLARQHRRLGADPAGQDDMRDWTLGRVIWVADRGFTSQENRRYLQRGGGDYIIGEKLRSGSAEVKAALSRQGRYQHGRREPAGQGSPARRRRRPVRDLLQPGPGRPRRRHPRQARHRSSKRLIAGTDELTATKRAELRGKISMMPGLNRFLRVTPGGLLRVDKAKIKAEENLDGKYLLRCSDPP